MTGFAVFTFFTTHDALEAERLLKQAGIEVVPVPAPKSSQGLCGLAMRVAASQAQAAYQSMAVGGIRPAGRIV